MKPQDILILLKLCLLEGQGWTQMQLAESLGISASEVNHGLKRLEAAQLYDPLEREVMKYSFNDLLVHAVRHIFPPKLGPMKRGMPTSHSGPSLSKDIVFDASDIYVWPDPNGSSRGQSLQPLYPSVPSAAKNDPKLYELLSLVDALRVGQAREVNLAKQLLRERLLGETNSIQAVGAS